MSLPGAHSHEPGRSEPPHGPNPGRAPAVERLERLLEELQVHARLIRESWQGGETAQLRLLAGQLKSLAEGSANTAFSESAAELEAMLLAEEAQASAMCEKVEAMILQCRQAAAETT